MRIMAVDYGDARTGIAVSDALGMIAGETFVITQWDPAALSRTIVEEAAKRDVGTLVLGLPKNMDGTEGPRAEKARAFAERLKADGAPAIVLWDERRTTVDAHRILHANGKKEKKHRQNVDAVAAALILEGYLGTL
ncbi:MAG: Holliday junction resolvase RuvX [Oscillospiraceae bacterium]